MGGDTCYGTDAPTAMFLRLSLEELVTHLTQATDCEERAWLTRFSVKIPFDARLGCLNGAAPAMFGEVPTLFEAFCTSSRNRH